MTWSLSSTKKGYQPEPHLGFPKSLTIQYGAQSRKVHLRGESQQIYGFLSDGKRHRSKSKQMRSGHSNNNTYNKEGGDEVKLDANRFKQIHWEVSATWSPILQAIEEGSIFRMDPWMPTSVRISKDDLINSTRVILSYDETSYVPLFYRLRGRN